MWAEGPHLMLASGRHALMLVASELRRRGAARAYLPEYLCSSMLEPFAEVLEVEHYALTPDLQPVAGAFDNVSPGDALLVCDFFGRRAPTSTVDAVAAAGARDVIVVSDTTHSPFVAPPWVYDLNIISLRKTLPLHDGAVLMGALRPLAQPLVGLSTERLLARAGAASRKRVVVDTAGDPTAAMTELRDFEEYLAAVPAPASMSQESRRLLTELDLRALASRRSVNAEELLRLLDGANDVTPLPGYSAACAPAFLTVRVPDARAVQRALAEQAIYCPIHWPQPRRLADRPWRSDLISLPVDHRYGVADMRRIAEALQTVLEDER